MVRDGEEALKWLRKEEEFSQKETPDLILLDLILPKVTGQEVLRQIRQDFRLKSIPVIVMTTSQAGEDSLSSYESIGNYFITKPMDLNHFMSILKHIQEFWLQKVN